MDTKQPHSLIVNIANQQSRNRGVRTHPDDYDYRLFMVTPRQLEVIRLVAEGATDREIATILNVSPRTVSNTLHRLYDRLGTSSRARLASLHARGCVKPRPNGNAQRQTATVRHAN